nr:zinc finger protein 37 [Quercus suber]
MRGTNCIQCARSFKAPAALEQHIRDSPAHVNPFGCNECGRTFQIYDALKQHIRDLPDHPLIFNCDECDRTFYTQKALQQHIRDSPIHNTTSARGGPGQHLAASEAPQHPVHDSSLHVEIDGITYSGIASSKIQPVFRQACRLMHSDPRPSNIIEVTGTTLSVDIVSAIIEGALRLVPPSSSPVDAALRQERSRARAEHALRAETDFVTAVRTIVPDLEDEVQQRWRIRRFIDQGMNNVVRSTPDILLPAPSVICGVPCCWIEYKDSFGFKLDPFVHRKSRQQ